MVKYTLKKTISLPFGGFKNYVLFKLFQKNNQEKNINCVLLLRLRENNWNATFLEKVNKKLYLKNKYIRARRKRDFLFENKELYL